MKKMLIKSAFSFIFSLLILQNSIAQQSYVLSVKQAVELAFKNVIDIKNAKLDYKIAEARNKEITGLAFPQISGTASGNHYLSLPLIQFPDATSMSVYNVLKEEGVKNGNGQPITNSGQLIMRNVSFFAPWNVQFGGGIQQLLFEPQVFVGLLARKAFLESSSLQIKVAEDKLRESVYKNYYAVLISEKQLNYLHESFLRLKKLTHDNEIMYQNGFAEKLDVDKATVTLNNTQAMESQLKTNILSGYAYLKFTLGINQEDSIQLTDKLSVEEIKKDILENNFSYEDRNEVKLLNNAIQLLGYDARRYKLSYAPVVAAYYNFQRNGQKNSTSSGSSNNWFWYNTNIVGLNVNVPIFDGFQKSIKFCRQT